MFRNVKDFGAKGDGKTDDTAAINRAIAAASKSTASGRCGPGTGCQSTTTKPALVYFPAGTYLVSAPIVDYYLTQLVGNARCPPTIKVTAGWTSPYAETPYAVIDGNPNEQWAAVNIFWRQIRNFVIDMTAAPATLPLAGVHWSTGQATSLQNIEFRMSTASNTQHQGVWSEEGSGGFLSDLTFVGGLYGLNFGNQQYTMRGLSFSGCQTAIRQAWDWSWMYKDLAITNCTVGLDLSAGYPSAVASDVVVVIDSVFTNVETAIVFAKNNGISPAAAGELVAENVYFNGVTNDIQMAAGNVLLSGAQKSIGLLGYGHGYQGTTPVTNLGTVKYGRPESLLDGSRRFYAFPKPSYADLLASDVITARSLGAKGDGVTDDTAALQSALALSAGTGKLLFLDYGVYVVSATLVVPAGARVAGESFPVILGTGAAFSSITAPRAVLAVGGTAPGAVGSVELSDFVVSTRGAAAGAILIQWNLSGAGGGQFASMWDVHTRVGGFAGSNLSLAECPMQTAQTVTAGNLNKACMAAFLSLHVPAGVHDVYFENSWLWVADHDADNAALTQITVYAGRGVLLEGTSLLLYGVAAEHHTQYQFHVHNGNNIVMGLVQSETAYYQPNPGAALPYPSNSAFGDPALGASGWGAVYSGSTQNTVVYGAGHYSFFSKQSTACEQYSCQTNPLVSIQGAAKVTIFGLVTTGVRYMVDYLGTSVADATATSNYGDFMGIVGVFSSTFLS